MVYGIVVLLVPYRVQNLQYQRHVSLPSHIPAQYPTLQQFALIMPFDTNANHRKHAWAKQTNKQLLPTIGTDKLRNKYACLLVNDLLTQENMLDLVVAPQN